MKCWEWAAGNNICTDIGIRTWETPLYHCCISMHFKVSAFLTNIQMLQAAQIFITHTYTERLGACFSSVDLGPVSEISPALRASWQLSFCDEKWSITLNFKPVHKRTVTSVSKTAGTSMQRKANPWFPTSDPLTLYCCCCCCCVVALLEITNIRMAYFPCPKTQFDTALPFSISYN